MKTNRQNKQQHRLSRSFMEARALGYEEQGEGYDDERFPTPHSRVVEGRVEMSCERGGKLIVPFVARYRYGAPFFERSAGPVSEKRSSRKPKTGCVGGKSK